MPNNVSKKKSLSLDRATKPANFLSISENKYKVKYMKTKININVINSKKRIFIAGYQLYNIDIWTNQHKRNTQNENLRLIKNLKLF